MTSQEVWVSKRQETKVSCISMTYSTFFTPSYKSLNLTNESKNSISLSATVTWIHSKKSETDVFIFASSLLSMQSSTIRLPICHIPRLLRVPGICVPLPTVQQPRLWTNQISGEQGIHPSGCWSKGLHTKAAQCTAPASLISSRTSRGFLDHSIEGKLFETLHNLGLTERYEAAKF